MAKRRKGSKLFKYKPVSVKDLLIEMKDISELMVDLAYSSILLKIRKLQKMFQNLKVRWMN